jgi:hypothetical protein
LWSLLLILTPIHWWFFFFFFSFFFYYSYLYTRRLVHFLNKELLVQPYRRDKPGGCQQGVCSGTPYLLTWSERGQSDREGIWIVWILGNACWREIPEPLEKSSALENINLPVFPISKGAEDNQKFGSSSFYSNIGRRRDFCLDFLACDYSVGLGTTDPCTVYIFWVSAT